jgi:predicted helicase
MRDADKLNDLITAFLTFKNETVYKFETALENFKADIPKIVESLRAQIEATGKTNTGFIKVRDTFLELCKAEINPEITLADVREMMIQHILTSDIFNRIFNDADFHRHNTVARELENLVNQLFNYSERRNMLGNIEHYYDAISAAASEVTDHHEKQKFLKVLYENFYKVYNPKAADRLGVVYTPNEIVQFMVESTDHLLEKHFGKTLADENVEILDPATGTGTFITTIIDHIPKHLLANKYKNELHANEVAILPYYIANLNVEFTFKQKMGYYEEYKNLCFVDTLEKSSVNWKGTQNELFGLTTENAERIIRQNKKKISVIVGNPPYSGKQGNYNFQNSNKTYKEIDKRIKETYIKNGTAQNKNQNYDMYLKFIRWASDRIAADGVIALITNRSFFAFKAFDGVRKSLFNDFQHIYVIDLGGDINNKNDNTIATGNVFGIKTGVGITFLIKDSESKNDRCNINYFKLSDELNKDEKLQTLSTSKIDNLEFSKVIPDKKNDWINQVDKTSDEILVNLIDKDVKKGKSSQAIFMLYSRGIGTYKDDWLYDINRTALIDKVSFYVKIYNKTVQDNNFKDKFLIKWDEDLNAQLKNRKLKAYDQHLIKPCHYRPFSLLYLYDDVNFIGRHYKWNNIPIDGINKIISFISNISKPFSVLSTEGYVDLNFISPAAGGTQCLSLYRFDSTGERLDNITDWALHLFNEHYKPKPTTEKELSAMSVIELTAFTNNNTITKEDIFHYTYGVLHNPAYRKKYELDLKREFPRLPLYDDFYQWTAWGKQLMDMHINYETVEPYPLKLVETKEELKAEKQKALFPQVSEPEPLYTKRPKLKVKLKADKETGIIELDEKTSLSGIPKQAWEYKLGNRSALEWILDQYKEKKPSDPTIEEKFNTYRFADYKEQVIDLLKRVCTVSVETMRIIGEMEKHS